MRFFVTGTDTGIGKTYVTAQLLRAANARGWRAAGMKPVASGCDDGRSDDALALIDAMSPPPPPYATVNPYALREPLSPHIAARIDGREVGLETILDAYARLAGDFVAVEGVGGWCVPLSDSLMQADLVRALALPVVLVVGVRLGCINHALLTARGIRGDGCDFAGWIANHVDPTLSHAEEAVATIAARLGPPLGAIDRGATCPESLLDRLCARLRPVG